MKVLIGDSSSYKAIVLAKYIHKNYENIEVYGFDSRNFTRYFYSKYFRKNFIVKDGSLTEIKNLIKKISIDVFIPVINSELANYWKNRDLFGRTLDYLGSFSTYDILNDKVKLYNVAMKLGVPVPLKYENFEIAQFPFVVKPTNLSSSKGVIYVRNISDLPTNVDASQLMIQQYVEGFGLGYSFYCKDGQIISGYGHKRLAEYPISGGSSTYREEFNDSRLATYSSLIVKELGYTGFAMFEFKYSKEGNIFLIEVNPRIWGSVNQGLTNGTNYLESILGPASLVTVRSKKTVKTYLSPLLYISLFRYLLSFQFKPIFYYLGNIGSNKADVSLFGDLKGYFSLILRKLV